MKQRNWKAWAWAAGIRAVRTMAQTAAACIGVSAASMDEINWFCAGSSALVAGILSLLTSIAGLPEIKEESQE